jgi:flagellar basal body P-ring formation protein FlgA
VSVEDPVMQSGDLSELPAGIVTDPGQAVGRTLIIGIPAGRPLCSDMLRSPMAVQQGQTVKVVSQGSGFRVATEGRALNSAADGQVAQARLPFGQTFSAIAHTGGTIEISR